MAIAKFRVFIDGSNIDITKPHIAGTSLRFTVLCDRIVDNVTIEIDSPSDSTMIEATNMTKLTTSKYEYIYQTEDTSSEGEYLATIKVIKDGNVQLDQVPFIILEQS